MQSKEEFALSMIQNPIVLKSQLTSVFERAGNEKEFDQKFNQAILKVESYEDKVLREHYLEHRDYFWPEICTSCLAGHLMIVEQNYHWEGGWDGLRQIIKQAQYPKMVRVKI